MIPAHAYEARSAQNHRGRSNLRRAVIWTALSDALLSVGISYNSTLGISSNPSYLMLNRWNSLRRNVLQFRPATA